MHCRLSWCWCADEPVCVEQIQSDTASMTEAVFSHVRSHATPATPVPGVTMYTMKHTSGMIVTCENASNQYFSVQLDYSGSQNVVSSRDTQDTLLVTNDCIPPMTKQIIMVLSPQEGCSHYSYSMQIAYTMSSRATEEHMPAVSGDPMAELHRPVLDPVQSNRSW